MYAFSKKCKFKKADNFIKIYEFPLSSLENMKYCLYGRLVGKSCTINEYVFTGFDKKIYGACAVILMNFDNKMVDIIVDDWKKFNDVNFNSEKFNLNSSKIVSTIEAEIGNIIIDEEKMDLEKEEKEEKDLEEDKLNYGSELSEDMYIYSSDDE